METLFNSYKKNFENLPQPVLLLDKNFKVLFANKIAGMILEKVTQNYENEPLQSFMKYKDDLNEIAQRNLAHPEILLLIDCYFEYVTIPFLVYINPVLNESDELLFYHVSFRPKPLDTQSDEAKDLCYKIFDKMNIGIVKGENVTITFVNPAFSRLTGIPAQEVLGKSAMNLAMKFGKVTNLKKVNQMLFNFLIRKKNEKEIFPFRDKILEVTTNDDLNTTILRDITAEQQLLEKMEGLHYVAQKLAKDLNQDEYFDIVLKASRSLLKFSIASIILREGDHLVLHKTTQKIEYIGKRLDINKGIYGKTYRKQRTFLVNNYLLDKDATPTDSSFQSTLSVPIDKFGVFQAHSTQKDSFTENDRKMAELLISHLVQALKRKEISESIILKDQNYRTLFENTPVSTIKIDSQGNFLLANQRFINHFNCHGKIENTNIFDFVSKDDRQQFQKQINQICQMENLQSLVSEVKMQSQQSEEKNVISYMRLIPENKQVLISLADITQQKIFENKLNTSLKEKEILLKEIHHRVKNNLQLVSSFIRIFINSLDHFDKDEIINEINSKIQTIVLVHERLYKSDSYKNISIANYIQKLVPELLSTYPKREVLLKYDLDDIFIDLNKSIPLGLILSEVITNSLKYAFPDHLKGKAIIGIELKQNNKFYLFRLYDNGIGMTTDKKSFGLELISILTQQLNGSSEFISKNGVEFRLKIPVNY
ncbi:MAG: PAS domain S-box protein [Candidatus Marinimicrobia bacterium]|nr:PAS domain S-box protein [Candidatus Neomarinimicrobiota bacterium]